MTNTDIRDDYPHVIIRGNPLDGFEYSGPFPTRQAAAQYGNTDPHNDGDWWTAPLHAPAEEQLSEEDAAEDDWQDTNTKSERRRRQPSEPSEEDAERQRLFEKYGDERLRG